MYHYEHPVTFFFYCFLGKKRSNNKTRKLLSAYEYHPLILQTGLDSRHANNKYIITLIYCLCCRLLMGNPLKCSCSTFRLRSQARRGNFTLDGSCISNNGNVISFKFITSGLCQSSKYYIS